MKIQLFDYNDLNIVEFVKGNEEMKGCILCNKYSKYLHGSAFSIIQGAFNLSSKDYSYYDISEFKDQNLITLRNHLQDHLSRLNNTESLIEFEAYILKQVEGIDFMNELKTFYPKWKISWESFRDQLLEVYRDILEMIDYCIDEEKSFYVKGY